MTRKRVTREIVIATLMVFLCVYVIVARVTFSWRHPWMTQSEQGAYIGRMLTFGTVTREEVKAWEEEP